MPALGQGDQPVLLRAPDDAPATEFALTRAAVAPWRGMMLLQLWGRLQGGEEVELIHAPPVDQAAARLRGGDDDFAGNLAFSFGGAILLPFANRIRGQPLAARREIVTDVAGHTVRLPRNWGGRASGAEQYAMHGLLLDRAPDRLLQPSAGRLDAEFELGDFERRWPSKMTANVTWSLEAGGLRLQIKIRNVGEETLPAGVGWHPYFKLPGDRARARLHVPAAQRLMVNNYDEVLPTGEKAPVAGTQYDFSAREGAPLGALYLDDCFVELPSGPVTVSISDPAAGYGIRLRAEGPVSAVQVYAPKDQPMIVLEPQTNWADPFGRAWSGQTAPIPLLAPGQSLDYDVVTKIVRWSDGL